MKEKRRRGKMATKNNEYLNASLAVIVEWLYKE